MSMQPVPWPEPDPQVAAAIGTMYGSRKSECPLAVTARDRLGEWLGDEAFAAVFGVRGRPGWSPSRLALVTDPAGLEVPARPAAGGSGVRPHGAL
jgi:hypothetical protein